VGAGVDFAQSKAVFKVARKRAGLRAMPEHRGVVDWPTVEEELRFLDQDYSQDGRTGLMLQTLQETGARASELAQLRVEDDVRASLEPPSGVSGCCRATYPRSYWHA
jgi:integrase/recombinase XerD